MDKNRYTLAQQGIGALRVDEDIKAGALANLEEWMDNPRMAEYQPYIAHMIDTGNFELLLDSFWRMIPFGTGGRRGPVGAGPNRINPFTISLSVQGHCDYLRNELGFTGDVCVVVAHDVRQFFDLRGLYPGLKGVLTGLTSLDMARASACTYAANGITAYVVGPLSEENGETLCTDRYLSTPELSFQIRKVGAVGGLNISASHNHPDDNGGKFYNRQGGQEIPPDDEALLKVVEKITAVKTMSYGEARQKNLIRFVTPQMHAEYIAVNKKLSHTDTRSAKVAYTPLCGTGMTTVYETLCALGYQVEKVEDQSTYDGSFASVRYRIGNPEVPDSMDRLEQVAIDRGCDVGFSTDPDADRLGMIAADGRGGFQFLNGNELGVVLLQSIISAAKKAGTLTARRVFINTLVTSSLQRAIARSNGVQVIGDLMVGFKYMGDVMGHLERSGRFPPEGGPEDRDQAIADIEDFLFTTEESHGYLLTSQIRDKDACGAAVHLAGLAGELKDRGQTFDDYLMDIYRVYGYHRNVLRSLVMEGITGLKRIRRIQEVLRKSPPTEIAGYKVLRFVDNHVVGGPILSGTDEASRDVLLFELDGGEGRVIRLVVRPSGTEPKTKVYVEVPSLIKLGGSLDDTSPDKLASITDDNLEQIIADTNAQATKIGNEFMLFCLGPDVLPEVYPCIEYESLLVSDLVPVDHKVGLCNEILPALVDQFARAGVDGLATWLDGKLARFGEDPRGLVRSAATAWIERKATAGEIDAEGAAALIALFNY